MAAWQKARSLCAGGVCVRKSLLGKEAWDPQCCHWRPLCAPGLAWARREFTGKAVFCSPVSSSELEQYRHCMGCQSAVGGALKMLEML